MCSQFKAKLTSEKFSSGTSNPIQEVILTKSLQFSRHVIAPPDFCNHVATDSLQDRGSRRGQAR